MCWSNVLRGYTREVHSIRLTVRLPAVVRLLKLIRVKPRGIKFSRQNIYARDRYECQYCGANPTPSELTYDHVVPRALGGQTDWTNIVTCCIPCNRRKGGKLIEHSNLRLRRKPRKPGWGPYMAITIGFQNPPEPWHNVIISESGGGVGLNTVFGVTQGYGIQWVALMTNSWVWMTEREQGIVAYGKCAVAECLV